MLGPLRQTRNLLLVNLRGTGNSTLVNCPGLEHYSRVQQQSGPAFNTLVGQVRPDAQPHLAVQARRVRARLGLVQHGLLGPRCVRGAQGSAAGSGRSVRRLLRELVRPGVRVPVCRPAAVGHARLDLPGARARPVVHDHRETARQAFGQACDRWRPATRRPRPGAWSRISKLAARLDPEADHRPDGLGAGTPDQADRHHRARWSTWSTTRASTRSSTATWMRRPGRCCWTTTRRRCCGWPRSRSVSTTPTSRCPSSATACISRWRARTTSNCSAGRRRLRCGLSSTATAMRREPSNTFAPFTVGAVDGLTSTPRLTAPAWTGRSRRTCSADHARPPLVPPRLHVLILSGTFDSLTPWLDGATLVASQLGKSARVVRVANLTHVTLQGANDACPAQIFQTFLNNPAGLAHQNTSCAGRVAPIHAVGGYPLRLAQARPLTPRPETGVQDRVAGGVDRAGAVGDEISRFPLLDGQRPRAARREGRVPRRERGEDQADRRAVGGERYRQRHRELEPSSGFVTAQLTVTRRRVSRSR